MGSSSEMGGAVAALVQEVGRAIVPPHLLHTHQAVLQILETVQKLRQLDQEPYSSHTVVLAALLRHVQLEGPGAGRAGPAAQQFHQDRVFARYATNIYSASLARTEMEAAAAMGICKEEVLLSGLARPGRGHCPKFLLFLDHDHCSLVLCLRGTFSFNDLLMDVVCEDAEFLNGFAHQGTAVNNYLAMECLSSVPLLRLSLWEPGGAGRGGASDGVGAEGELWLLACFVRAQHGWQCGGAGHAGAAVRGEAVHSSARDNRALRCGRPRAGLPRPRPGPRRPGQGHHLHPGHQLLGLISSYWWIKKLSYSLLRIGTAYRG